MSPGLVQPLTEINTKKSLPVVKHPQRTTLTILIAISCKNKIMTVTAVLCIPIRWHPTNVKGTKGQLKLNYVSSSICI
jgi:hypothetical protein